MDTLKGTEFADSAKSAKRNKHLKYFVYKLALTVLSHLQIQVISRNSLQFGQNFYRILIISITISSYHLFSIPVLFPFQPH